MIRSGFVRGAAGRRREAGRADGRVRRGGAERGKSPHQFIIELLLRVMKNTWLLPPERTEAKNTCRARENISEDGYNLKAHREMTGILHCASEAFSVHATQIRNVTVGVSFLRGFARSVFTLHAHKSNHFWFKCLVLRANLLTFACL